MAISVCVWDKCNNNCTMCTNPDEFETSKKAKSAKDVYSYEKITERLNGIKDKIMADDTIVLGGGEPTIHPRFLDVFQFVRENFPGKEVRILTNGRRFAYEDFTKDILKADNLRIAVSACGPNAEIHDGITRTRNSFAQMVRGLDNLLRHKRDSHTIEIRTVISKLSYQYLGETLAFISNRFSAIDGVIVIFMEIEGQAEKNLKSTTISYFQAKPILQKIYPFLINGFYKIKLYHFPLCVLEPQFWPFTWRTLPENEVTFISSCQKCKYKQYCLGIHKEYLKHMGGKEFIPITKKLTIQESDNAYHPILEVESKQ